jgi:two-component system OmpR family response regulator
MTSIQALSSTTDADRQAPVRRDSDEPPLRLLIVEDDREAAQLMADDLAGSGIDVSMVHDGGAALEMNICDGAYDVLVVDRMLPGCDGLTLVQSLRARGVETPVLLLTALGAVADRVEGLRGGGDDYVVKPVDFDELHARIRALAKRRRWAAPETVLVCGTLELDRLQRKVRRDGKPLPLLPLEFRLLEFLLLSRGQPVTRKMLLEEIWGFRFDPRTNIVETHLSRLRTKLGGAPVIQTIRGVGYLIHEA